MTYAADSAIPITDVGESTGASGGGLVCRTDRTDCCDSGPGRIRQGEWIYSDGVTLVGNSASGDAIYRTRETSTVLRTGGMMPQDQLDSTAVK